MKIDFVAILKKLLPILKKIVEEKIIPKIKQRIYTRLNSLINKAIKSLSKLHDKILNCEDEEKKQKHLKGFNLGLEYLEKAGHTILESVEELKKLS